MSKYDNTSWFRLVKSGGALSVSIGANNYSQANGGTSLPCVGCFIQIRNGTGSAWIDSPSSLLASGPGLGGAANGFQPMWLPVSDVSTLFFAGTEGSVIDIVYLTG